MLQRGLLAIAILAMLLASMVLVACGGDDDDGGDATPTSESTEDGNGSGDDGDGSGDDGDGSGDDGDGSGADDGSTDGDDNDSTDDGSTDDGDAGSGGDSEGGLEALRQAAENLESDTFYVEYNVEGGGLSGTLTLASEPPSHLFAMSGIFDGEEGELMMITLEDASYFCSSGDGEQACLKSASDGSSQLPVPTLFETDELVGSVVDSEGVSVSSAGSQTIAGIDADCYDVASPDGSGTFCVGDGVLVLMDGEFDGEPYRMEATTVVLDPDEINIEVPDYPVTDLSGLGD